MRLLLLTLRAKAFRPVTTSFLSFRGLTGTLLGVGRQCKANFWYLCASVCSIRSVQLSLLFLIWFKTESIFLCVLSCTAQHLIHLGVTYLQPLCDFLSSEGHDSLP